MGDVVAVREARVAPYAREHERSRERRFVGSSRPTDVAAYVRWARWAYRQEPPFRIHAARGLADDGTPGWSSEFAAWVTGGATAACATDQDGYYLTPFRCAVYAMHGRFEGTAEASMADYCLAVAAGDAPVPTIASRLGLGPGWTVAVVTHESLRRLWERFAPTPGPRR